MMATPTTPTLERLLTVAEVAETLQVSRATIYSLIKSGQLRPVPLGIRKTRFRRADIEAYIGGASL